MLTVSVVLLSASTPDVSPLWRPLIQVPYYRKQTTSLHCGLWLGMTYLSVLGLVGALLVEQGQPEEEVKLQMTWVRFEQGTLNE
jgi:hypothetical protein